MEFKDLFLALVVVSVGLFAFLGLATSFNSSYGTTMGVEFENEYSTLQGSIVGNLSEQGARSTASGFQESGQDSGTSENNLLRRALSIMNTIPNLIALPGNLIRTAGNTINAPGFIIDLSVWAFNFAFILTLAYLFITGSRRLLG